MKKLRSAIACLLCVTALSAAGCNKEPSAPVEPDEPSTDISVNIIGESNVYMDCAEQHALKLDVATTEGVSFSSSDPTMVAVNEIGVLFSGVKTGKCTITAKKGDETDVCEVVVTANHGLPDLEVSDDSLVLSCGASYTVYASANYNAKDVTSYVSIGYNLGDSSNVVSLEKSGENGVTITAGETVGETSVVLYSEILGTTYARSVDVSVRKLDVIYLVEGAIGNVLTVKKDKAVYTSAVSVYHQGTKVPSSELTWQIENENVCIIASDGKLVMHREGKTDMYTEYAGERVTVSVQVVKEHVDVAVSTVEDVVLGLTHQSKYNAAGERIYIANQTLHGDLVTLDSSVGYGEVISAALDGEKLDASQFTVSGNKISAPTSVLGTTNHGQKPFVVETETDDTIYSISFRSLLITSVIKSSEDLFKALEMSVRGNIVRGYFVLDGDVDCDGKEMPSVYAVDWDYSHGFRGTLDGRNNAVKNLQTSQYGLTSQIGNDALLTNLRFVDVIYTAGAKDEGKQENQTGNSLFARGIGGATFDNISITLSADSTPDLASTVSDNHGLLCHASKACTYKNITIDAQDKTICHLFGKDEGSTVFENFVVIADAITAFKAINNSSALPNGVILKSNKD